MRSPRVSAALAVTFSAFFAAGCSTDQASTAPAGCRSGEPAIRQALARAPGRVELDGARLSSCFADTTSAGDLAQIGSAYIGVAGELAARAEREPEGRAALQLGYLVGATRRAASGTQGVTYELQRRIEQELGPLEGSSRAFARGLRAGERSG